MGNSKLADICDADIVAVGVEVLNLLYLTKGKDAPHSLDAYTSHSVVKQFISTVPKLLTATKSVVPAEAKPGAKTQQQTVSGKDAADIYYERMKANKWIPQVACFAISKTLYV